MRLEITLALGMVFVAHAWGQEPHALLAPGAKLEQLSDSYGFTEGPASDSAGNVYFTDQPNNRIVRWDARTGQLTDWLQPAGRSNGMYFDAHGRLITCADEKNQLWSIDTDKSVTVLIEGFQDKLLDGPNDLWIHPDGRIYFTDPHYPRSYWSRDPSAQQPVRAVYLYRPAEQTTQLVAEDFRQPNGIVGTPDGKTLYVSDIGAGKTFQFAIKEDGRLADGKIFCELGSDGMTIDERGNVYLTGRGVSVFGPDGKRIEHIDVPGRWTANVTFGGVDHRTLFVTASRAVFTLQMNVRGAAPTYPLAKPN